MILLYIYIIIQYQYSPHQEKMCQWRPGHLATHLCQGTCQQRHVRCRRCRSGARVRPPVSPRPCWVCGMVACCSFSPIFSPHLCISFHSLRIFLRLDLGKNNMKRTQLQKLCGHLPSDCFIALARLAQQRSKMCYRAHWKGSGELEKHRLSDRCIAPNYPERPKWRHQMDIIDINRYRSEKSKKQTKICLN